MQSNCYLTKEDWYPTYGLTDATKDNEYLGSQYLLVEVPLTLAIRYEMALTEFLEIQRKLKALDPDTKLSNNAGPLSESS